MTSAVLTGLVRSAFADVLRAEGTDAAAVPVTVDLRRGTHADYATSIALRAAGSTGLAPLRIAHGLADRLSGTPRIARACVAGGGFVNVVLSPVAHAEVLRTVLDAGVPELPVPARPADGDDLATARARCHADVCRRCGLPEATPAGAPHGPATWGQAVALCGADNARYALLRAQPRLDVGTVGRDHDDNPAYLVRHTHAHLRAVLRHADDLGVPRTDPAAAPDTVPTGELTGVLLDLAAAHDARGGVPLTDAAERLARSWWACGAGERALPRGDEPPAAPHSGLLAVCGAVGTALAACLARLGVSAPERM